MPASIPTALTIGTLSKDDVQDVEVIIGPGAALYGPDAVAGVVSIRTIDPKQVQGTIFAVGGGTRSIFKTRFRHTHVKGRWGWKILGDYQRAHDYEVIKQYCNADSSKVVTDEPDFTHYSVRGGVGLFYYPTAESRLQYTANSSRYDLIDMLDSGRAQRDNTSILNQRLIYKSQRFYTRVDATRIDSGQSLTLHAKAGHLLAGASREEAIKKATFGSTSWNWSAEARYSESFRAAHFNMGVDFRQVRRGPSPIIAGTPFNQDQVGFYGHVDFNLGRQIKVTLAAREDFHPEFDAQFSPKAALIFKPGEETAFRVTFNRAFRSPSILNTRLLQDVGGGRFLRGNANGYRFGTADGSALPSEFAEGIPAIAPEKNTTFDLGFKTILAEKMYLDVSGYYSKYENFISPLRIIGNPGNGVHIVDENGTVRAGETTLTYFNFGKQTVRGLDVGFSFYATHRTTLKGNASFIKAGDLKDAQGLNVPFNTPPAIFNLGLSTRNFGHRGTFADLMVRHVREYELNAGVHDGIIPTYTVVDANVGYRAPNGLIYRVTVKNLLNNKHIEFIDAAELGAIAVAEIEYEF